MNALSANAIKTSKPWSMPLNWLTGEFHHLHRFVVVNTKTMRAVEGHYSSETSARNVEVLNQHELRNGREAVYQSAEIPSELHNQPPHLWG